jgi:hypothetical protein
MSISRMNGWKPFKTFSIVRHQARCQPLMEEMGRSLKVEGFETRFLSWQSATSQLDASLRPIANRPVDISDPAWADKLKGRINPLDEGVVGDDAASLISEIFDAYPRVNAEQRDRIRKLFAAHRAFGWAAGFLLPFSADASTLRPQLLLFSILDQGSDSRDALLWLRAFCAQERADRAALPPLLREIAALSSAVDLYGFGSTRAMLLNAAADLTATQ